MSASQTTEAQEMVRARSTAALGGLAAIAARCEADQSVSGRFVKQVLLKERNVAPANKLAQLLSSENQTVAAVGILHLLGSASVLALLQAQSVSVEQIYRVE
jgi:uncharacterized protein YbaP (TraB family)